ncbi:hypothetical protein L6259_00975 [Candidatus Parcubacteria bacterium]|nr:hypothetical protein [Patescibacteria group bacterium]MCG2693845.1 hypothetical protein [Candidatus Parcubacteria bacterium]
MKRNLPRKIPAKEKVKKKETEKTRKRSNPCNRHHLLTKCRVEEYLKQEERRLERKLNREEIRQIRYKEHVLVVAHQAWNTLFAYKFPWEAIERIKSWSDKHLVCLQKMLLKDSYIEAWNTLFGKDAPPRQAIEIIRIDWTPPYPPAEILSDEAAK